MCTYARFFPWYFSSPFCRFSIFVFFPLSLIFFTLSRKWRPTLFALQLRHLFFLVLWPFSQRKVNKWSKVKTLEDKTRSVWPSFFSICEKCYRKSCKYMRNTSTRYKCKKKTWNSQYQGFEHNGMKIYDHQRLESLALKRKRRRTCRHDVRRIWKLYSKGRPASELTWCEPSGDHLNYRWLVNIQRTSPQITRRAKAVTMLRLEKCVFRHTLGARTCYTSPLRKCQKTQRRTFWLAIFRLFNVKWIMNNTLSFAKGIFNNQWNLSKEKIGTNFWNTLWISESSNV